MLRKRGHGMESLMENDSQKTLREQRLPIDVVPLAGDSLATDDVTPAPFATPAGRETDEERPVVNPVTGGAL
jgi:hypothetical protein